MTTENWSRLGAVALSTALLASVLGAAPMAAAATGDATEFSLAPSQDPEGVAAGPDGSLWVTNQASATISKVSTSGAVVTFTVRAGSSPREITAGPDGAMWFTMFNASRIGRITTSGEVTEFVVPTAGSAPIGIAAGPDGALWFTEFNGNKIGRITTSGAITEYPLPTANSGPLYITAGPAGSNRMYFTQYVGSRVGIVTMDGQVSNAVSLPAGSNPAGITVLNGTVWLVEEIGNSLTKLVNDTTAARISLTPGIKPWQITPGPGNTLWVTAHAAGQVQVFSDQGAPVAQYALPTANSGPWAIDQGPDGNMWVTQSAINSVARMASGAVPVVTAAPTVTPTTGVVAGTALTASTGTWTFSPTSYAYQWQSCTGDASTCSSIVGATSQTYTAQTTDTGKSVRVQVTASNLSGPAAAPASSALVAVGNVTPPPPPPPGPATGPTAEIATGVTATLNGPTSQKRGKSARYSVTFSVSDAQGTVTFRMVKGSKTKTFANIPVSAGSASVTWRVPKKWRKGTTRVNATFTPTSGSPYSGGNMTRTVRIR